MKKNNLFYLATGILFFSLLYFNSFFFKGSKKYLGVTTAKEYKISSEKAATIKKVLVLPGQAVKKGELLLELTSLELEVNISKLDNEVSLLKKEVEEKRKELNAEIAYLRAQKGIKNEEITSDILKINKELALNLKLLNQVTGDTSSQKTDGDDPLKLEIASLKEKKRLHRHAMDIKIEEFKQRNISQQRIIENKVERLVAERNIVLKEQERLNKYATFNGVIENVYVKENEEVRAYTPMISVNPIHPTSVIGYLIGKRSESKEVGEKVIVSSYDHRSETFEGEIIGLGAITVLPDILQKSTSVKAYGREVFIAIEEDNKLSTGQKVVIN